MSEALGCKAQLIAETRREDRVSQQHTRPEHYQMRAREDSRNGGRVCMCFRERVGGGGGCRIPMSSRLCPTTFSSCLRETNS